MSQKKKSTHCDMKQHPSYHSELPRLKRLVGQVEGVQRMVEQRRYCPDIIAQLRAIRSAAHAIESNILEEHLNACVSEALGQGNKDERDKKIAELKNLYRRFHE